jgi:cytidyltransferase-like protein
MVADLFHYGHVSFLRRVREYGDYTVVGLLTDEMAASYKRTPVMTFAERFEVVQACRLVDEVRTHDRLLSNEWLQDNGFVARVYAVGSDRERAGREAHRKTLLPEYRIEIPYEAGVSTTSIIQRIKSRNDL